MKLIYIKRKISRNSLQKHEALGVRITQVKKYFLGIPLRTLYECKEVFSKQLKNNHKDHLFI